MLRRSIAIAGVVAAISAASASAATTHAMWLFLLGTQTTARAGVGCTYRAGIGGELTTACSATGHATLTYAFTLPKGVRNVYPKVDGYGQCPGNLQVTAVMDQLNARSVHEVIKVPGGCTAEINSIRVVYFSKG